MVIFPIKSFVHWSSYLPSFTNERNGDVKCTALFCQSWEFFPTQKKFRIAAEFNNRTYTILTWDSCVHSSYAAKGLYFGMLTGETWLVGYFEYEYKGDDFEKPPAPRR